MRLPSVDFELTYWRIRRRLQRVRADLRAAMSRARAEAHLRHLHRVGRLPERPEPEDTFVYRALWAIVVVMLCFVLAIDVFGPEAFQERVGAVLARIPAATLSADTDAAKSTSQHNI